MKFIEVTNKLISTKDALLNMFDYYPNKRLMIMISEELFKGFSEDKSVFKQFVSGDEEKNDCVVYDIYENKEATEKDLCGSATFMKICGVWVLCKFESSIYNYGGSSNEEAELAILLR